MNAVNPTSHLKLSQHTATEDPNVYHEQTCHSQNADEHAQIPFGQHDGFFGSATSLADQTLLLSPRCIDTHS